MREYRHLEDGGPIQAGGRRVSPRSLGLLLPTPPAQGGQGQATSRSWIFSRSTIPDNSPWEPLPPHGNSLEPQVVPNETTVGVRVNKAGLLRHMELLASQGRSQEVVVRVVKGPKGSSRHPIGASAPRPRGTRGASAGSLQGGAHRMVPQDLEDCTVQPTLPQSQRSSQSPTTPRVKLTAAQAGQDLRNLQQPHPATFSTSLGPPAPATHHQALEDGQHDQNPRPSTFVL